MADKAGEKSCINCGWLDPALTTMDIYMDRFGETRTEAGGVVRGPNNAMREVSSAVEKINRSTGDHIDGSVRRTSSRRNESEKELGGTPKISPWRTQDGWLRS